MKICLCALLACTALTSQADITVKVMKGGTAPHLYAWDNSDNPINGNWPGTQMTDKDADGYWTTTISTSLTKINMILNMGGDTHKTDNYVDISGVNGVVKVLYDGDKTMFGTMPEYAYQGGKVAYFASPSTWDGNIYCRIKHNGYEEAHQMTKIGTDGMGLDVYADFNFINWGDTPQQVQFYDMSNHNCNYMNYTLGGYYNAFATYPVATFYNLSAANGFTDAQFRAGIYRSLRVFFGRRYNIICTVKYACIAVFNAVNLFARHRVSGDKLNIIAEHRLDIINYTGLNARNIRDYRTAFEKLLKIKGF